MHIDANDNGVDPAENILFSAFPSTLPARVARMNYNSTFEEAVALCGKEFKEYVTGTSKGVLGKIDEVDTAFKNRKEFHPSGNAISCDECPASLLEHFE